MARRAPKRNKNTTAKTVPTLINTKIFSCLYEKQNKSAVTVNAICEHKIRLCWACACVSSERKRLKDTFLLGSCPFILKIFMLFCRLLKTQPDQAFR